MKAMIFAAGLGTRLKPYTDEHPKALVDVAGMPMLQRVILKLKNYGITRMVVNVHHFADQIVDFLQANDNFGCDITISDESAQLLDTGGGLLAARQWLDGEEPILVHNADILTDFPLTELEHVHHYYPYALATLAVGRRDTSRYLLFDDKLAMQGWTNVTTGETRPAGLDATGLLLRAFAGVQLVSPKIFDMLEAYAPGPAFPIMPFYIQACQTSQIIGYPYPPQAMWHDVGKPEALAAARRALAAPQK